MAIIRILISQSYTIDIKREVGMVKSKVQLVRHGIKNFGLQ